jgi:hypothetical protein
VHSMQKGRHRWACRTSKNRNTSTSSSNHLHQSLRLRGGAAWCGRVQGCRQGEGRAGELWVWAAQQLAAAALLACKACPSLPRGLRRGHARPAHLSAASAGPCRGTVQQAPAAAPPPCPAGNWWSAGQAGYDVGDMQRISNCTSQASQTREGRLRCQRHPGGRHSRVPDAGHGGWRGGKLAGGAYLAAGADQLPQRALVILLCPGRQCAVLQLVPACTGADNRQGQGRKW